MLGCWDGFGSSSAGGIVSIAPEHAETGNCDEVWYQMNYEKIPGKMIATCRTSLPAVQL